MEPLRRGPSAALAGLALATAGLLAACAGPRDASVGAQPADVPLVAAGCRWERVSGGGLGLWAQACDLTTGRWRVTWSPSSQAFELQVDGRPQAVVVQAWPLAPGQGPEAVVAALKAAGQLPAQSGCRLAPARVRPLPAGVAGYVLAPPVPVPAVTASGEIPEPPCGPYGASTHGVRYFAFDPQRPDRVVFVDEGQDQPLFDARSLFGR
ncbi:MAG: hypothetical protein ACOVQT_11400 [Rubrivivax sp.]